MGGKGYLDCDDCDYSYKLGVNESADDYSDVCYCGGHLRHVNVLGSDGGFSWWGRVSNIVFCFVLFLGLKVIVGGLIAGLFAGYRAGGDIRNGLKEGFITGFCAMSLLIFIALIFGFSMKKIDIGFTDNLIPGLGRVILFAIALLLLSGAIGALGGVIGAKIKQIRNK
jgi:hypothetical protein